MDDPLWDGEGCGGLASAAVLIVLHSLSAFEITHV